MTELDERLAAHTSTTHHGHMSYTVGIFLIKYLLPFVIFLRTLGNLLSFIVMMKKTDEAYFGVSIPGNA